VNFDFDRVILFWVNRLSFMSRKELQNRFAGLGEKIGGEEWAVLLMLWQRDGLLPSEIAEATTRDRTTTTRMLDRLVKKGLVLRGSDKADGRRVVVSLTERGQGLREVLVPAASQFVAEATKGLEPGEIDRALQVLKAISANIADMDG
jgi:DNA-binding MarR family transcriptional regulator